MTLGLRRPGRRETGGFSATGILERTLVSDGQLYNLTIILSYDRQPPQRTNPILGSRLGGRRLGAEKMPCCSVHADKPRGLVPGSAAPS